MTDEQDGIDASPVKRKLTKRERFRGAVQRGVGKVKKPDEESSRDGDFTLNDDVKDFLAFRSPYSKPTAVQSLPSQSQKPDTKPTTVPPPRQDVNQFQTPDPSDVLPHFPTPSRDPLSVPRIDVAKSPRFPQARDLFVESDEANIVSSLRIQDDPEGPHKRKTRRIGLAVRFSDSLPIIIGEGGDDAEAPTMHLMHARARARARSDASMPEPQQHQGQFPPSPIPRNLVGSPGYNASPQYILPQSLQNMEFAMTLTPGLGHTTMPPQSTSLEVQEPPAARTRRLKMRAEEGKTLRQSFHDAPLGSGLD